MYVETRSHTLKQALRRNKTHFMCTLDIVKSILRPELLCRLRY
jgi:hypothetical protein